MKRLLSGVSLAILIACALSLAATSTRAADAAADSAEQINTLVSTFNDAFNNHDARAAASTYTEDGITVIVTGEMFHGSEEVVRKLTPLFAGPLKTIHRDVTVKELRMIRPDAAVMIADFLETGVGNDAAPIKGFYTWVVVKRGSQWHIDVWQESFAPAPNPSAAGAPASQR